MKREQFYEGSFIFYTGWVFAHSPITGVVLGDAVARLLLIWAGVFLVCFIYDSGRKSSETRS